MSEEWASLRSPYPANAILIDIAVARVVLYRYLKKVRGL